MISLQIPTNRPTLGEEWSPQFFVAPSRKFVCVYVLFSQKGSLFSIQELFTSNEWMVITTFLCTYK